MQKLENNEARPKFTGSYKKKHIYVYIERTQEDERTNEKDLDSTEPVRLLLRHL